jgi:2,6-dihydroxypyridine 3-monooxygenase
MGRTYEGQKVAVVGGSIGGLTSALLLKNLGFDVDVFERSETELDGRGGGIVLQPDMLRWFREHSRHRPEDVSTSSHWLRYLGPKNEILHDERVESTFSSWSKLYLALLDDFGRSRYHLGEAAVGLSQTDDSVEVAFAGGRVVTADLVVFADGINSVGRAQLLPEVRSEYAGYVGWRGTVIESEVSDSTFDLLNDALTYSVAPETHIVLYQIPGVYGELQPGKRQINYVWYRNIAAGVDFRELLTDSHGRTGLVSLHPGQVQRRFVDEMKAAAEHTLSPAAAEVVVRTKDPYIQSVMDLRSPKLAFGRVAIVGDAGSVARPHAAAGTAKAAADAWALYSVLNDAEGSTIEASLRKWEPEQLRIAERLISRVTDMGSRAQFTNTFLPGQYANRFGLYGPGK